MSVESSVEKVLIATMTHDEMEAIGILAYIEHVDGGDMFFWPDTVLEDIKNNALDMISYWAEYGLGEERSKALSKLHKLAVEAKRQDCGLLLIRSIDRHSVVLGNLIG